MTGESAYKISLHFVAPVVYNEFVSRFVFHLQKSIVEMCFMIQQAFGEEAASRTTTCTWWDRFKDGIELLDDDE